jgi:hypothetical protein
VLVVDEALGEVPRDELVDALARQVGEAPKPRQHALGAELALGPHSFRIIETAGGHADVAAADEMIRERRAAGAAELPLGQARRAKHRRLAARPVQLALLDARERHDRPARRLLAHPAMADAGAGRRQ